ncbi:lipopolysaccharide kinase InaA family protein [Engelhardtia mirabilis]|uniref:Lipopolysaccharide core heptose(I) kinase RfaP n=1 Tax=Engelhardtia mirabilis TaxID=2528011 RepID=A0A518BPM9_9BACT|nr:Lipopolysaccharide core heptose(I) kinase RfaP [Planctomycetes bacterium Pla133]QDV03243.1 Lipopolysaccharide core heptose(I) kinase RfaP [Planctomycetes bacterium Pla86]
MVRRLGPGRSAADPRAPLEGDFDAWWSLFAAARREPLRQVPGRRTDALDFDLGGSSTSAVLKEFAGGDPVDWWFERLRGRPTRTPAAREFDALAALGAANFPVPAPLLLLEEGPAPRWLPPHPGRGLRSAVLLEAVEIVTSLDLALAEADTGRRRDLLQRLGQLVADLHGVGWYHRDLYLGHFVLDRRDRIVLLDLGRARHEREPRRRWLVKDLAALLGSAPPAVSAAERLRFLGTWLERVRGSVPRSERRRWVREVQAKARRLMAHRPRHHGRPVQGVER